MVDDSLLGYADSIEGARGLGSIRQSSPAIGLFEVHRHDSTRPCITTIDK